MYVGEMFAFAPKFVVCRKNWCYREYNEYKTQACLNQCNFSLTDKLYHGINCDYDVNVGLQPDPVN